MPLTETEEVNQILKDSDNFDKFYRNLLTTSVQNIKDMQILHQSEHGLHIAVEFNDDVDRNLDLQHVFHPKDWQIPYKELQQEAWREQKILLVGDTPLMWFAMQKNHQMVRILLENGADPLERTKKMKIALQYAVKHGDVQTAAILLQNKKHANQQLSFYVGGERTVVSGYYPIHMAFASGDQEMIDMLLYFGGAKELTRTTQDSFGEKLCPLGVYIKSKLSKEFNKQTASEFLKYYSKYLQRGLYHQDGRGYTILHTAAYYGLTKVVDLLVNELGMQYNAGNYMQQPIEYALTQTKSSVLNFEVIQQLLKFYPKNLLKNNLLDWINLANGLYIQVDQRLKEVLSSKYYCLDVMKQLHNLKLKLEDVIQIITHLKSHLPLSVNAKEFVPRN